MHISLTPELQEIVKSKVESGLYNNASEVVREALRFMEKNQDLVHQMKLNALRSHLSVGEAQLASGEGVALKDGDEVSSFFENLKH